MLGLGAAYLLNSLLVSQIVVAIVYLIFIYRESPTAAQESSTSVNCLSIFCSFLETNI